MDAAALPTSLGAAARVFAAHWSPRLLAALALGLAAARLALGGFGWADAAAAALLLALWPLQEWAIHVFVLHFRPRSWRGHRIDFAVPRLHRAHHRDPWRLELVFIPLRVYLVVPLLLAGGLALARPVAPAAVTAAAGYFALALHYEWVHFLIHTRVRPRTRWYRRLWRNHRLHHFRSERHWFGVTMLGGDRLLGTAPDADRVPPSPTARALWEAPPS